MGRIVGQTEGEGMNDEDISEDPELDAMRAVYAALKPLDEGARSRVLDYVMNRLNVSRREVETDREGSAFSPRALAAEEAREEGKVDSASRDTREGDLEGISVVAQKWMRRNGLTADQLSHLFSLGVDEIDLVAKSVPGKNKKERMRNVLLLTGVAAYLGGGVARVADDDLREACNHYNAYDQANFAAHMKDFAAEASGSKAAGYTLTSRGLTAATQLVKEMTTKSG
jgi:hypothetical protein